VSRHLTLMGFPVNIQKRIAPAKLKRFDRASYKAKIR